MEKQNVAQSMASTAVSASSESTIKNKETISKDKSDKGKQRVKAWTYIGGMVDLISRSYKGNEVWQCLLSCRVGMR